MQQKKDSEHKTAQKSDKEQSAMSKKVDLRSAQKELEAAESWHATLVGYGCEVKYMYRNGTLVKGAKD